MHVPSLVIFNALTMTQLPDSSVAPRQSGMLFSDTHFVAHHVLVSRFNQTSRLENFTNSFISSSAFGKMVHYPFT